MIERVDARHAGAAAQDLLGHDVNLLPGLELVVMEKWRGETLGD